MRVCMITSVPVPPTEGVGYYVWNLACYLVRQGHQVQIITRGQHGKPFYEELNEIPIWRPRFYPIYPLHVHLHGLFVQRLVRRLEEEIDVFHLHTPLPPPIRSRCPVLLTVHSMMLADARTRRTDSVFELLTKLQSPISFSIERRLFHISRSVTTVSRVTAELVQEFLPPDDHRVEVAPAGVDIQVFSPGLHNPADPNRLLYVGRLAPGKGLEDLVQALALVVPLYPQIKMSVVGTGPLRGRIRSLIRQRGLEHCTEFLGHVNSRERLCALYRQAWGLIMPSHHETGPMVVLEAMACGTPAVATRVGIVPDAVTDEIDGLIVPPGAPEKLAEAICRLLGDAELRARLGTTARHTVEDRFSWHIVGSNHLRCYQALLNKADQ